jgi:hypothetical protein
LRRRALRRLARRLPGDVLLKDMRVVAAAMIGATALFGARNAAADQRPLPYTFGYATLEQDRRAAELSMDLVPLKVATDQNPPVGDRYQVQAGLGFAPTDRLELSGHLMLRQELGASATIDGLLERMKLRFAEPGDLAADIALVAEVGELYDSMLTGERLVLERPAGPVRLVLNLATEQRYYRGIRVAWTYAPTVGALVSPAEHVSLGIEGWARGYFTQSHADAARYESDTAENRRPHVYAGPALALQWPAFCWSVGAYVKADEPGRSVHVGDRFGRFWIRTVITASL